MKDCINTNNANYINIAKSIFILIVIADHNDFLKASFGWAFVGLSFHVLGFYVVYLISLLTKDYSLPSTIQKSASLYKTYLIFFFIGATYVYITSPESFSFYNITKALYSGEFYDIKSAAGLAMLWFIPSFVTFMYLSLVIKKYPEKSILFCALIIMFFLACYPFLKDINEYAPLGLLHTLYIAAISYSIYWVANLRKINAFPWILLLVFAKTYQSYFGINQELGAFNIAISIESLAGVIGILEGMSGVIVILLLSLKINSNFFNYIGVNSLKMYCIHPFVGVTMFSLVSKIFNYKGGNFIFDLGFYFLNVTLTLLIVYSINKINKVNKFIF